MSSVWKRPVKDLAGNALRHFAEWVSPSPVSVLPSPAIPGDPRRLESTDRLQERTLETPPGGPWDGYRSTSWTQRDLSPLSHDLMLAGAQFQWASSPLVKRCLEIQRDFILQKGIELKATCEDEQDRLDTQQVLDSFWQDEENDWEERIGQYVIELASSGELTLHHTDNPWDGTVHIGFMNPEGISKIEPDPLNASNLKWVVLKEQVQTGQEPDGSPHWQDRFRVIHRCRDGGQDHGKLVGDVFHLRINGLTNASRGLSDLMPVLDWVDMVHQLAHSEVDRAILIKAFLFDVSVDGDQKAIELARKRNQVPPAPGSVNFHSAKEKWTALAPSLSSGDFLELVKFLQGWICACLGVPEHYLYEANTVSKNSAAEMDDPVYARARQRQTTVKNFLHRICRYALEQAYFCRRLLRDGRAFSVPARRATFVVQTVDPDQKNFPEQTGALVNAVDACARLEACKFGTHLEAANLCRWLVRSITGKDEKELPTWSEEDLASQGPADQDSDAAYQAGRSSALQRTLGFNPQPQQQPALPALPGATAPRVQPSQECIEAIWHLVEAADWDESKHHRAGDGKFGSGGVRAAPETGAGTGGSSRSHAPSIPIPERWRAAASPEDFTKSRDQSKRSAYLSPSEPSDLSHHTLILSEDGNVGVAVSPEGDLQNVFNNGDRPGAGRRAILEAIHRGAVTLDCFDGYLPDLYANFGFVETGRMSFSDEYSPKDWDYKKNGRPDVVFMAIGKDTDNDQEILRRLAGPRDQWTTHDETDKRYDDYDQAKSDSRRAVVRGPGGPKKG